MEKKKKSEWFVFRVQGTKERVALRNGKPFPEFITRMAAERRASPKRLFFFLLRLSRAAANLPSNVFGTAVCGISWDAVIVLSDRMRKQQ